MADWQPAQPSQNEDSKDIPEAAVDAEDYYVPFDCWQAVRVATLDAHCVNKTGQAEENAKKDEVEKPDVVKSELNVGLLAEAITVECVTVLAWITLTFLHVWWAPAQTDFCRLKDTPAVACCA